MADDDITTGPAQAAVATTVGVGVANSAPGLLALTMSGANSAIKRLQGQQEGAQSPTAAEMKFWNECADKASSLIRREINNIPDQPKDLPHVSSGYTGGMVALGAVLGGLSFSRFIPGKWKWLSGAASVASLGGAVAINSRVNAANAEIESSAQMVAVMKQGLSNYASVLDNDPATRAKLAQYFSDNITAQEITQHSLEAALLGKCAEFAQANPQLSSGFAQRVSGQPAGKDCGCPSK
jgi:hypothetical protein